MGEKLLQTILLRVGQKSGGLSKKLSGNEFDGPFKKISGNEFLDGPRISVSSEESRTEDTVPMLLPSKFADSSTKRTSAGRSLRSSFSLFQSDMVDRLQSSKSLTLMDAPESEVRSIL